MEEVLEIERESFDVHWSEEDFLTCLRQRNCIGLVAETESRVVGFMIYELHKSHLEILNFAVASEHRRQGVGRQMIDKLVSKLSQQHRSEISLDVRETNLAAQLFFSNQNFRAIRILKNHYFDTDEDAYRMAFQLVPERIEFESTNRLAEY